MAAPLYLEYHENRVGAAPDAAVLVDFSCTEPVYLATSGIDGLWVVHGGGLFAGLRVNVATMLFKKCVVQLPARLGFRGDDRLGIVAATPCLVFEP